MADVFVSLWPVTQARAHINYIQYREGEDRGKGPREFFNSERDDILGREVKERLLEQERNGVTMRKIIMSPGVPGADVQDYTREMMERLEQEKGQRLDWYAVEHQNTEHPHAHVVVMGKDLDGGRVRLDLDDMKNLRGWGDRYLEREHTLDRYLDRETERLIRDGERGREIEYQRGRGDKMYERLMYGDPDCVLATSTITIRLPEETIEKLQRLAESRGKSASVLGRDMIVAALEGKESSRDGDHNALVIEYLQGFGGVLMALTHETVAARYFAEMATNYATDMESLLRERKVMEPEARAALMKQFEATALKAAQQAWNTVLGLERQPATKRPD